MQLAGIVDETAERVVPLNRGGGAVLPSVGPPEHSGGPVGVHGVVGQVELPTAASGARAPPSGHLRRAGAA